MLTINIEAILIQGEEAQLSDTMGMMAQLPVQLLSVQPRTHVVRTVCAHRINSSGCSIFLRPGQREDRDEEVRTPGWGPEKQEDWWAGCKGLDAQEGLEMNRIAKVPEHRGYSISK